MCTNSGGRLFVKVWFGVNLSLEFYTINLSILDSEASQVKCYPPQTCVKIWSTTPHVSLAMPAATAILADGETALGPKNTSNSAATSAFETIVASVLGGDDPPAPTAICTYIAEVHESQLTLSNTSRYHFSFDAFVLFG